MAVVFDAAVLIILALLIFLGYKRGFIRTVVNLVGYVVSAVLAFFLSQPIAEFIFDAFFRNSALEMINKEIDKLAGGQSVAQILDAAFAAIPEKLTSLASTYVGPIDQIKQTMINAAPAPGDIPAVVVDQLIGPIATIVMQSILFLILFIVFCILVKLITGALKIVDKLPLIGQANAILGLLVGVVQAVIFVFLFTSVVALIIQLSGNGLDSVNTAMIEQTLVFKLFYGINPLTNI